MAGKARAVGAAIKYGPLVMTAAQKYAPQVLEQLRAHREPAERFVQDRMTKGNQRKKALQHAATVVDGSILQVFHLNRSHWIVYSGEEPIAVHPPTSAAYAVLLKHADLTTRVRPHKGLRLPRLPRRGDGASSRGTSAGTGSTSSRRAGRTPAPAQVRYHDAPAGDRTQGRTEGPERGQRPTA